MQLFATDYDRLAFLLETDASLALGELIAQGEEPDSEEVPEDKRPKYITNYIGSKQKLVDWIWKHTPEGVASVLDAFSGSAVVAYMYKTKGLSVYANDRLHYAYHAARAIVENDSVRISEDELAALLAKSPKAGTFVQDNFKGLFFANGVHGVIDNIRANADSLSGFKKDIALFALGKTCMSGKGGFGHFSSSTDYGKRQDTPEEFEERFTDNVTRINALVFDNGKECKAYAKDINDILPGSKVDLAYFDPPYATEFSTTNYEKSYHFIEGLMTYWDGLEINQDSKTHHYATDHKTVTKANASEFFGTFLANANHIPNWLISYRDHAYPNEGEMKDIISASGMQSRMQSQQHKYNISSKHSENSTAMERLFICSKSSASTQADSANEEPRPVTKILSAASLAANCHTSIPVEVRLGANDSMSAHAIDLNTNAGDPQFSLIMCRVGTNRNGDHFLPEELSTRYTTAINKKIDLKHSQDLTDIVGGIVGAEYVDDETGGRVECVGELYTADTPTAALAYKLMKRGIISQVSMECDYEAGECSICGKTVANKNDYCVHLRKFKGAEYQGKPVYEILHGVTFTGLGLLDRKGADENARITQVASEQINTGGNKLEDDKKDIDDGADAAKKKAPDGGGNSNPSAPPIPPADDKARIKELESENKTLKQQVIDLEKQVQELEAASQAAANKTRAQKLIQKLEKSGMSFGSDEDREKEMSRLSELSDDAFSATEAAYDRAIQPKSECPCTDKSGEKEEKNAASASMRSNANVRPVDVDDKKLSLEDKLKQGFMTAYRERVGAVTGEKN